MRDNLKDFVNANRESFDRREPSADLWNKIRPQVVPPVQERKIKPLWKWASMAAAILLVGTATFIAFDQHNGAEVEKRIAAVRPYTVRENESDKKADIATVISADTDNSPKLTPSMAIAGRQTKRKQSATANVMTTGFNKMQEKIDYVEMLRDSSSASARLSAVLALKDEGRLDRNSIGALERTAVSDQSSNVRIAAIETILSSGLSPKERQQKVQDFFVVQNDPTLQMELMQMMVQQDDAKMKATTKDKLNEIVEDPFTLKFVKEQAYAVLLNQ
ncbi:hypothetical protein [Sphingobacterium zeae]|uniref:HEAT repeat domain-containing protein n=1 Tax=Sphingobacterium zeae TaxID=1776859 RepID=A0ABU0UA42_9SPHI|nr:hypothetical protein [Sphingobacterium zeae]MDQ1151713.1 hypothetical protein [Sphingobacterium zeae]